MTVPAMETDEAYLPQHRALVQCGVLWWVLALVASGAIETIASRSGLGPDSFFIGFILLVVSIVIVSVQGGDSFLTDSRAAPFVSHAARRWAGILMIVYLAGSLVGMAGVMVTRISELMELWTPVLHEIAVIVVSAGLSIGFIASLAFGLERWRVRHAALLA